MNKKIFIPVILFIGIGLHTIAQEKSKKELRGDKYVFSYSYTKAIDCYTQVKQLSLEGQRNLAESYRKTGQSKESEIVYSKLVNTPGSVLAEDYYNYAMILKSNGKYDESNKWMDKFAQMKQIDLRAIDYVAHKGELSSLQNDDGKYKVENLKINSDAEDFGACYYNDKVVFASTRAKPKMIKRDYNLNGKPFLDMYVAQVADGQLKDPEIFSKKLDGKMHDGPASFAKNGTCMAFTRNDYDLKKKDKIVKLQICFSTFKDGKWSDAVPFIFNNKDYSAGHPCLTSDGNTMYFTCDMPGGYGGGDIYRTTRTEKGEWTKPENMGNKINSEGDEMFPFFEETNGVLFFTSNGRFGLGGFDVFMCMVNELKTGRVYNAGAPLNTQYDDFALIVNTKMNKGYFSSNRAGGSGDDDLYSIDLLKDLQIGKKIQGLAKDKAGIPIPYTFITLKNEKGIVLDTMTTKENAAFVFLVDANKEFKLIGKKEKYIDGDTTVNTKGKEFIVKADVTLRTKEEVIHEKIQVGADLTKILDLKPLSFPEAEIIYFDLDKYTIRADAETELAKIVSIMNKYPDLVVELRAHTDCRDTKAYNQALSDKRAKASADYIKKRITKPERIYGKGYGETQLVNSCACEGELTSTCSEEDHQKNRRTEFIIVKK